MKNKVKNKKQDTKDLEAELTVLREELAKRDNYQDIALRLQAEFDNFRKRSAKERLEFIKYANEGLILELVGILDNLERSIKAAYQKHDFKVLHQGVEMTSKQLQKLLEEKGLKKIKCVGEKFDPVKHEAIEVVESDEAEEGDILDELQPGYMLNDHVLRPAMVKVIKSNQDALKQDALEQEDPEQAEVEEYEAEEEMDPNSIEEDE